MRRTQLPEDLDVQALKNRLQEAESTLQGIYNGEVDSLVVSGPRGKQVFALQGADHSYRLFVEGMQDGALTFSPAGVIYYVNQSLAALVKAPISQVIGSSIDSLFRGECGRSVKEMMASSDGPGRRAECALTARDGGEVPVRLSLTRLATDQGTVFCMLVSDRTENKAAEAALDKSQRALNHAQKMEVVGRLAGGVAHDINNLSTAIQNISQDLLESFGGQDPRREDVQEIMKATVRAFAMTKQLLSFSRRQMAVPKVIDVKASVAGMDKLLRRLVGKGVDIQISLGLTDCAIKLDPGQLEQIIMNLAINAGDAMPGGGVLTIRIGLADLRAEDLHFPINCVPGPFVKLEVSDTGTGMDKETLEHIFEPFFTTKDVGKGTGLGLATVYGIVEQARGDIHVLSEVGKGSAFEIYLPACAESAEPPGRTAVPSRKPNTETILVVEDDDVVRKVVVGKLAKIGYAVLEASDGRKAVALANSRPDIDLVLSDVMMPGMNGRQAVEAIQSERPALKALFMSGYPADVIADDGILHEGVAFIDKAALGADLPRRIRELLDAPVSGIDKSGPEG